MLDHWCLIEKYDNPIRVTHRKYLRGKRRPGIVMGKDVLDQNVPVESASCHVPR
jgi:hypothetical protein